MSQAPPYTRSAQFADDERDNAGGRSTVNTADVDAELDAISTSVNALVHNQSLNQRDDGEIRDQRVKLHTLAPDVLALLVSLGANIRGAWLTATDYGIKDVVQQSGNTYITVSAHTSGVFATDLAAGKWLLLALGTNPTASAIAFVSTAGVSASNVQAAIEEVDTEYRSADAALIARLIEPASASNGAGMMSFSSALAYAAGTIGKAVKDFIASIASYASGSVGAGMVGYSDLNTYPANTVGAALLNNSSYVFTGSGELGDDTTAIASYYASLPRYSRLKIKGLVRVTSTVTFGRQIDIICESPGDGFVVDVGVGNDGIVIKQATALDEGGIDTLGGINNAEFKLHVFGKASACRNALVMSRVDRARSIFVWVYAGAANYGLVVDGCLINDWKIQLSANFRPPISSPAFQVDAMLVQKNATYSVASNTNLFRVNIEGGRHGYVQSAQAGEGANTLEGEIEGVTGNPINVADCLGLWVKGLKMEENRLECIFAAGAYPNLQNLRIGPGVVNFRHSNYATYPNSGKVTIAKGQNCTIDGYYGDLYVASTCFGTTLGQLQTADGNNAVVLDTTAVSRSPIGNSTNRNLFLGGPGAPSMSNIWFNPFFDLWTANGKVAGPPDGCDDGTGISNGNAPAANELYPGNPSPNRVRFTQGSAVITDGFVMTPSGQPWGADDYVAVTIAIKVPSGQDGAIVFVFNGLTYHQIGIAQPNDEWTLVRGAAPLIAGNNWHVTAVSYNVATNAYSNKQMFIGGMTIVRGVIPATDISDSHGRRNYVSNSVTYPPPFLGAKAYTPAGKWYLAHNTALNTDWDILN